MRHGFRKSCDHPGLTIDDFQPHQQEDGGHSGEQDDNRKDQDDHVWDMAFCLGVLVGVRHGDLQGRACVSCAFQNVLLDRCV